MAQDKTPPRPLLPQSRWADTRMFRFDGPPPQRAEPASSSGNTQTPADFAETVVPQPYQAQHRQSQLPTLEMMGGGIAVQPRSTYGMPQPNTYAQWPPNMTFERRASTGNWRHELQQEPEIHASHGEAAAAPPRDPLPVSAFFSLPYTQIGGGGRQLERRNNSEVEGMGELEQSYASALTHNAPTPSSFQMGHHRREVNWNPVGWSERQAWPALGAAEQSSYRRPAHGRALSDGRLFRGGIGVDSLHHKTGGSSGSSSSSTSSDNGGWKVDLGGFRPSRMKEEQRGLVAAPTGSNYLGNKQSRRQTPRDKDDPNRDNCALWLTNLPADLTLHGFLALVNTGEVFATVFSKPKAPSWTQAAKLVFKTHDAAAQFLALVQSSLGIVVNGIRMDGTWNRNWYPEDRTEKTRVLQIECPVELTSAFWHLYFDECVIYQVENESEIQCDDPNKHVLEFRFARIDGQSEALYQAISKNPRFHGIRYRYAADPCNRTRVQNQV